MNAQKNKKKVVWMKIDNEVEKMEGRKEEVVGNVVARETTCSEGVRRMNEEIQRLEERSRELTSDIDDVEKKIREHRNTCDGEKDKEIQEKMNETIDVLCKVYKTEGDEKEKISKKLEKLRKIRDALEMHDELLAENNTKGKKRHVFVLKYEHDSIFYYKRCEVCGRDATKCDCRDEDGNYAGWVYADILSEVGDEDLVSHLPDEYFRQK